MAHEFGEVALLQQSVLQFAAQLMHRTAEAPIQMVNIL
jgi:hypothetical protein